MEDLNESIVDYSGRGLTKIEVKPCILKTTTLIYDRNALSKLNGLDKCPRLQEFSAADNRIVRMNGVEKLTSLTVLNLPNNSILSIEGLSLLQNLVWLNLSGNSIKVLEGLVSNVNLHHLDLSDNCITTVTDISNLTELETLLVHGNSLSSLTWASDYLPSSITVISLNDNNVDDLNEIASLSSLIHLEQLSLLNNPMTATLRGFNYRPFIISWCDKLKVLDGQSIDQQERLKAVSLYGEQELSSSEEQQVDKTVEILTNELGNKAKVEYENDQENQEIFKELLDLKEVDELAEQLRASIELQHRESVAEQTSESSIINRPRAAWGSPDGPVTLAVSPQPEEDIDQQSQPGQATNTGDLFEESSIDLLTSDSVYLPVSTPLRNLHPHATSPQADVDPVSTPLQNLHLHATPSQTGTEPQPISVTQKPADQGHKINNKLKLLKNKNTSILASKAKRTRYDSYDQRPIKTFNQSTSVSARKPQQRPLMQSKVETRVGERKSTNLPVSQRRTGGYGEKDTSSPALRSQALIHIKDVAELRKNKRHQRPQSGNNLTNTNTLDSNVRAHSESTQLTGHSDKAKNVTADGRIVGVEEVWQGESLRDSGFLSRPASEAVPVSDPEKLAAVKIQCVWRGHWARHHCPQVRYIREEMRRRRMEEHILYLKADLQRQKLLFKEERQLSNLQLEAIKHLWKEVQSMQSWRYEMVSDQSNVSSQKHLNKEIENTMEKIEVIRGQGLHHTPELSPLNHSAHQGSSSRDNLEATCEHLKSQVSQLQETVQGIITTSHYLTQAFQNPISESDDCIIVRGCSDEDCIDAGQSVNNQIHWGFTLIAPPSESQIPYPGQPLPPSNLQLHRKGNNSVFISWQPSKIIDKSQQQVFKPLLGYRIYVNDTAVGMVPGNFTAAVAECLESSQTYTFYVKGVSSIGESTESNSIKARVTSVFTGTKLPRLEASSSDNSSDESDAENSRGKSTRSKNEQSSQRTKKKSPRREKERTQSTKIQTEKPEFSEQSILTRKDSSSNDELPIYRYPRLHTPKSRSRIKSPDSTLSVVSGDNDPVSSDCDTLLMTRPPTSGYSPKTEDSRLKSGEVSAISKSPKSTLSRDFSPKHQTVATRPLRNLDNPATTTTTSSVPKPIVCWEETVEKSADDTDSRLQAHTETTLSPKSFKHATVATTEGSPVLQRQAPSIMLDRGHSQPTITLSKPRPVLDGKKKPSEPTLKPLDGSAKELLKASIYERRRTTVSDILEQQFSSKQISSSDGGVLLKSSTCPPSKIKTIDTLKCVSDEELRRSKSENSSPTDKTQPAVASDGDSSAPFTIKSRTQGTFVSKLLQKLQTFSKAQEQSIRDSKKTLKLRAKSNSDTALAVNEGEENWPVRWRRISGGEESEEEARGVLSDSAQCVTTATQAKVNKGHRRSSSMHGAGPFVVKDVSAVEGKYSPIIMDGGKKKTSPSAGSSGVRRHASFNGILPSRGQDIRPTSEETIAPKIKPMTKPAPTESSGTPTFRSRSPSPNASSRSGVHQPVISAAQLQRLKSPAGIGQ